jgi:hypothetical protein
MLMSGRKPKQESRSAEFRQRLIAWKRTPESLRPSLRALARELGTSHQLLKHYLDGLEKWRYKERYRKANEESDQIVARAIIEGRLMTESEEQRCHACTIAAVRATLCSIGLDELAKLKQEARRGPLQPAQYKMVEGLAKQGFPGAQKLLETCSQVGLKERKDFAEIVRETPRQEGETYIVWVRRIWDQCDKYDTKCPRVITEELVEKCSRGRTKNQKNNLPPIFGGAAKSFKVA